jgi:hypothetical protein
MATFEETYSKYNADRASAINGMYDAQKAATLSQLESA